MLFSDSLVDSFGCKVSPSVSDLSFRICYNLLLVPDIYVSVTNLQNLHGRLPNVLFFGLVPNRSILWIGSSSIMCFSFVEFKASGIAFFLFFFSYKFCFIYSIMFFKSSVFSFIILSCSFLSVIAVKDLEISNSSAQMVLKLHSFSFSISRLQKSYGVSSSDGFVQKKAPRSW